MSVRIQLRRDSDSNWETNNPVLGLAEIGLDITSGNFKIGNGVDQWTQLNYFSVAVDDVVSLQQLNNAIAAIGGTGLTFDSEAGVYNIDNPFDPAGTYSGLRAQATTKDDVGLGNVTNESKATMFTNAELTGVPIAPTAASSTNTTQIATTAFVLSEIAVIDGGEFN